MSSKITIDHIIKVVRTLDGNEYAVESAVEDGLGKIGLDIAHMGRFWDRVNARLAIYGDTLAKAVIAELDQLRPPVKPAPVVPALRLYPDPAGGPMGLDEYQARSEATAVYPGAGKIDGLYYVALGLASEAGEVTGKIKKAIRDDGGKLTPARREQLIDELGDVLWCVARLAAEIDAGLSEVADRNLAKLSDRADRGAIGGDGDRR